MALCRIFHTAPEQEQGPIPIVPHCSGSSPAPCPGTGHSQCDYTIHLSTLLFALFLTFVIDAITICETITIRSNLQVTFRTDGSTCLTQMDRQYVVLEYMPFTHQMVSLQIIFLLVVPRTSLRCRIVKPLSRDFNPWHYFVITWLVEVPY